MSAKTYLDLASWQRAMDLVAAVYETSKSWPRDEIYGLTNQIRRAAVSVPSNIAEGQGRNGDREFLQHLSVAHGSLREVETQLRIAGRLGYVDDVNLTALLALCDQTGRPLRGLIQRLRGNAANDLSVIR
jgi:four helix bundle protein